jgi:hypothetical protein
MRRTPRASPQARSDGRPGRWHCARCRSAARSSAIAQRGDEQFAGEHQRFLVREKDALAALAAARRLEAGGADDSCDHRVGFGQGRDREQPLGTGQDAGRQARSPQRGFELLCGVNIEHRGIAWLEATYQLEQRLPLPIGGQRHHRETLRMPGDDVERRRTDRAGGAENGDAARGRRRSHPSRR